MKPSKYRNKRTLCRHGHTHASAKEANRCEELALLLRAGRIDRLEFQKRFPLRVSGEVICTYVCDFAYLEMTPDGLHARRMVVEDVKSPVSRKLPVYRIKAKLFKAIFGFDITEV